MSNKMTKLSLNIRKTKIVEQALNFWNDEKIQTAAQTKKCHQSIQRLVFDWKRLSCISFGAAIFFLASAILASITLLPITSKQFFVILCLCSAGTFSCSHYLNTQDSSKGNICGLLNFIALVFLGNALSLITNNQVLWTSIIGGIIGIFIRSGLTWGISLWLFGLWFCQPNLSTNLQNIQLSMSDPRESALLFGIIASGLSIAIKQISQQQSLFEPYKSVFTGSLITSYIYLFGSLFLLSSNPQEMTLTSVEYLWAIALAVLSLAAVSCGIRNKLPITIRFGVVFLFLNIFNLYGDFSLNFLHPVIASLGFAIILWGISALGCFIACHHSQWEKTGEPKTQDK